jgi:BASS family bile acid:Na+ symporter
MHFSCIIVAYYNCCSVSGEKMPLLVQVSRFVSSTFSIWVSAFAIGAFFAPTYFLWIASYMVPLLGIIMLGMGLTLSLGDFKAVFARPKEVAIGVAGQFLIMPALAWALSIGLRLPAEVAIGVIVIGCCPGGTASNVMTYLAKGDVALSVAVTSITTLLAPIMTPVLIFMLASTWLKVPAGALFWSILQIVVIPIVLGIVAQMVWRERVKACVQVLPLISVVAIVMLVSTIVAGNQANIANSGLVIFVVVMLHNGLGLLAGYFLAKLCGMDLAKRKAISLEVGMQNSGLGVALAAAHFSPLAAVPSAIFTIWHNISGSMVATWYRRMKNK